MTNLLSSRAISSSKDERRRTVNRYVRSVAAALNRGIELGYFGNPVAWKLRALSDDINETGEAAVFLDAVQGKAVIDAASPAAARFLRGLELTGARPEELAANLIVDSLRQVWMKRSALPLVLGVNGLMPRHPTAPLSAPLPWLTGCITTTGIDHTRRYTPCHRSPNSASRGTIS